MANANPTDDRPNLPPDVGRSLSVRILDDGMYDDLRVIMQTGCDASAAVRQALLILANVYYAAWERGHYPEGVAPVITTANIAPYEPVGRVDQAV